MASATVVEALSYTGDEPFARATQPIDFHFPANHGPHPEYRTEWWYYTGNLEAQDGTEYGYQLTFFRSALTPDFSARESTLATNQVYMAHFALTDGTAKRHYSFERFARGGNKMAGATGLPHYEVWLDGWSAREPEPGIMQLVARTESEHGIISIELTLDTPLSPLLHGDRGLSQKGPEVGNSNYYYSLSRSKFGVFGDFQSRLQGFWSHLFRFRLQKTTYFISENRPNLTQKLDIDRQICIYVNCLARILSQNLKFGSTESSQNGDERNDLFKWGRAFRTGVELDGSRIWHHCAKQRCSWLGLV
ncbi:carotenoid 1,2-hydratase [Chloroflexi bacterium TSY]|nr:carotenoid 1,2-hydratase [Chloroflexi bacterium TSY]